MQDKGGRAGAGGRHVGEFPTVLPTLYAHLPRRHAPTTSRHPRSQDTTTALTMARSIAIHTTSTPPPRDVVTPRNPTRPHATRAASTMSGRPPAPYACGMPLSTSPHGSHMPYQCPTDACPPHQHAPTRTCIRPHHTSGHPSNAPKSPTRS